MKGLLSGAMLLAACLSRPSMALDWRVPWVQPHDPQQAAANSSEYAWHVFVALNWPADTRTRSANPLAPLGADQPVVWETWQSASDVFLDGGRKPSPWIDGAPLPPLTNERRFETGSLKDLPNLRHIADGRMVPLLDTVANARHLTEIRMNKITFDYIRQRGLYVQEGQMQAVAQGLGVYFPVGATNVKARWRPISEAERARYHTLELTLSDGSRRLYGLTALHIASKDLEHWFWATFEHVDNRTLSDDEGWQLPSRDTFACGDASADCNAAPRGVGLENTVWQHYRLRGTLASFVDAQNRPLLLANSELEAGMQASSSCITCHSRAAIGVVAGAPTHLSIFESSDLEFPVRRGYVGMPRAEWFEDPERGTRRFEQLDFVWSLAKAHSRGGT
jgi:hypothetical protein